MTQSPVAFILSQFLAGEILARQSSQEKVPDT